jgi:hypothetical protein
MLESRAKAEVVLGMWGNSESLSCLVGYTLSYGRRNSLLQVESVRNEDSFKPGYGRVLNISTKGGEDNLKPLVVSSHSLFVRTS